jgi:excisionase family DNA binding protein
MNQIEPNPHRLVDIRIVADYLDVAPDTVYTMVSSRRIPFVKVGRLTKFDLRQIDAWIEKNTVLPLKKPERGGFSKPENNP